jgi:hypothetical protein
MSPSLPVETDTLLHFELATDPDPPQASPKTGRQKRLALTFVANLRDDLEQAFCDSVSFQFDIGDPPCDDASYLTCVGSGIGTQVNPSGDWELLDAQPDGTFTFVRPDGVDPKVVEQGYRFEIFDIAVSPVVGTAEVRVTEHSSADDPAQFEEHTATFDVAKFPPRFASVVFETDTTAVDPHGVAHLRWEGDDSARYTLSWNGRKPIDVKGKSPWTTPQLSEDTVFTLTVGYQAEGRTVKRDYYLSIHVRTPRLSIAADRDTIRSGETSTLYLEIEHATNCVLGGGPRSVPIDPKTIVDGKAPVPVTPTRTTDYVLSGQDVAGHTLHSDEFTVRVLPKAPPAKADLVFIKTANTNGNVELHVSDGVRQYQEAVEDITTGFAADLGPKGQWFITQFWQYRDQGPEQNDLVFVKTVETGSEFPQLTVTQPSGRYESPYRFQLRPAPGYKPQIKLDRAAKGVWLHTPMVAHEAGLAPQLVFIQTADTASGHVEVYAEYAMTWADWVKGAGPWTSMYPISNAPNGTWLLADMTAAGTLPPDLVFIQTAATNSGSVEVSYATGASGYQTRGDRWVTGFDTETAGDGTWHLADMSGDGRPDLVFVKTANTDSGQVEISYAMQAERYKNPIGGYTRFPVADGPNGVWQVVRWLGDS